MLKKEVKNHNCIFLRRKMLAVTQGILAMQKKKKLNLEGFYRKITQHLSQVFFCLFFTVAFFLN